MIKIVSRIIAWTIILTATAGVGAAIVVPRIAGAETYTVLTGSMSPGIPTGSLVVTRPINPADLKIGDVLTYQLHPGKPTTVTHRIIEVGTDAAGSPQFVTQGDANSVADAEPVRAVQVRGKLWYSVPGLGFLATLVPGQQKPWLILGLAGALFLYAAWAWLSTTTDHILRRPVTTGSKPSTQNTEKEEEGSWEPLLAPGDADAADVSAR